MSFGLHSSFPRAPLEARPLTGRAILHIDGDAFFASCEQALHPELRGKPVITGKERGIAASMSYEAKARGVTRGMRLFEVKKLCPEAIIIPSDYETYSLFSKRFFDIVRRYTSQVEEYSIDECFADITGLRRPLRMSYQQIAECIQKDLERELGCTFSIGLASTKVVAKVASKWKKPTGLTIISGRRIHEYLETLPTGKIWGIGPQTEALLAKYGVRTAVQFARQSEAWVKATFSKPFYEIWHELNGRLVLPVLPEARVARYSIQKFKTFTPPSKDQAFIFAQLSKNIESACIRARRYRQAACEVAFFLRTHDFDTKGIGVKLSRPTAFPHEIICVLDKVFDKLYHPSLLYRQTGVALLGLAEDRIVQMDLFGAALKIEKMSQLYNGIDELASRYGKHTVFMGSSFYAHRFAQHLDERGDEARRKFDLFKGETHRKRLHIPLFVTPKDI